MINIISSELIKYDVAHPFKDELRNSRLSKNIKFDKVRDEIYTSGVLIESIMPSSSKVCYDSLGKPFFYGNERYFNVTHSDGLVILGYSDECELGIDFERIDRKITASISKKLCSESEKLYYEALEGAVADRFLLKLFTIKEAVSKLTGIGIRGSFSEYKVDIPDNVLSEEIIMVCNACERFFVKSINFKNGYLSIATKNACDLVSINL